MTLSSQMLVNNHTQIPTVVLITRGSGLPPYSYIVIYNIYIYIYIYILASYISLNLVCLEHLLCTK